MDEGTLSIGPDSGTSPAGSATDRPEPAAAAAGLSLRPPEPVNAVAPAEAESAVEIDPSRAEELDARVRAYVDGVMALDVHDPAFAGRIREIQQLGDDDVRASAEVTSRILRKPVAALQRAAGTGEGGVGRSLLELRRTVEDLDPKRQGDLLSTRRILGVLPFGDRVRRYFQKYVSSQGHINAILRALEDGKAELGRDNADIEAEKANLWALMGRLRQYVYLAERLDAGLVAAISAVERSDAERATTLREDLLFPARQKVQDLLTQLAVDVQGYLALDVIRRSNAELIKGVDRATTTTVSALRTAVIVAQALADQKLVLDQITALNTTTGNLIAATASMLRQQSAAVDAQAASATIDLEQLQTAFGDIAATIDEVDAFKVRALESMQTTIDALTTEIGKAQRHLERAGARDAAGQTADSTPSS